MGADSRSTIWVIWLMLALCVQAGAGPQVEADSREDTMDTVELTRDGARLHSAGVDVRWSAGQWSIRWPGRRQATLQGGAVTLTLDGTQQTIAPPEWTCDVRSAKLRDALGSATGLEVTSEREGLRVIQRVRLVPGQSSVLVTTSVTNDGEAAMGLGGIGILAAEQVTLGASGPDEPVVYVDSGGQGGTHMAALGKGQTTAGICAVHNPNSRLSLVCAFVSFEHDNQVLVAPVEAGMALTARTTAPLTLQPGEEHTFDPILIDCRRSPHEALEEYATVVNRIVQPPIPDEMPMGWLSWYSYRLVMTEDIVLANADVVARHFRKYGVSMIHPDHGWQYKDICGHWVNNDKFPHGMKWLSKRLQKMGMNLGLWVAPSTVSEFAPLFSEHPEALMHDANGKPLVIGEKWHWPPHGKTYNVDPLTPEGEQYLRDFGKLMRSYGTVYVKTDFIGGWGGAKRLRRGMGILREALGPDITIRPCSTALNTQLGVCNEIGIARDIGNASSQWEHLGVETLELASKWFMHGKFWHNNPDVLMVGDKNETPGEARGRVTLLALTGGVVFLGDNMPELEKQPDRLAMVHLVLPSSGQPARPIDLFRVGEPGRAYPRLWHLQARPEWGEWDVLGVFNWSPEPLQETISRRDLGLGQGDYLVFDFWAAKLLGRLGRQLKVDVASGDVACLRIMPAPQHPAVLSTDMHITQGLVDLENVRWDGRKRELSGTAVRAPGENSAVYVYVPEGYELHADSAGEGISPECVRVDLKFRGTRKAWSVKFRRTN